MACPNPTKLAQARFLASDSEVLAHLEECASCRLDWQIIHGARYALNPPGQVPEWLNERVMAEIRQRARLHERRRRELARWEPVVTGTLLAAATFAYLVIWPGGAVGTSLLPALTCSLMGGALGVLFLRWQDSMGRA